MNELGKLAASLGISSAIDTVSSGLNNGINLLFSKYNDKRQRAMMQYQNDLNIKNWQMQNDYNSPVSVMARLQDAGLNPNLIYGNSSSWANGSSVGSSSSSVSPASASHVDPLSSYLNFSNARNLGIQNDNLKKNTELLSANIEKVFAEIENLRADKVNKYLNNQYLSETFKARVSQQEEMSLQSQFERQQAEQAVGMNDVRLEILNQQLLELQNSNSVFDQKKNKLRLDNELLETEYNLRKSGFSFSDPLVFRIIAEQFPDLVPSIAEFIKNLFKKDKKKHWFNF